MISALIMGLIGGFFGKQIETQARRVKDSWIAELKDRP